jgi:hypothetical protein
MKTLLLKLALGVAVWGWLPRPGLAQTAGKLPSSALSDSSSVHPSATVEVLEDPSQVDDVIARMKRPAVKTPTTPVDSASVPIDSLQADRPSLPDDSLDKDTERPVTKAEKRALEIERRRRLHER